VTDAVRVPFRPLTSGQELSETREKKGSPSDWGARLHWGGWRSRVKVVRTVELKPGGIGEAIRCGTRAKARVE